MPSVDLQRGEPRLLPQGPQLWQCGRRDERPGRVRAQQVQRPELGRTAKSVRGGGPRNVVLQGDLIMGGFIADQWLTPFDTVAINPSTVEDLSEIGIQNAGATAWALGDQNYRLFYDGDLMTIASVSSLLPTTYYGAATIDQDIKVMGQGQEAASPLDDIDDHLGFLDFSIVQTNKMNPAQAQQISNTFVPVAEICVTVDASVINDPSGSNCLSFYHSRPSTAGTFTNQYTTISENDNSNSTAVTSGVNYDDLDLNDGTMSCIGQQCTDATQWDIQLTRSSLNCQDSEV